MRYGIPLGVLFLIGAAAILHRTPQPLIPVNGKTRDTAKRLEPSMPAPVSSGSVEALGLRDQGSPKPKELPLKNPESVSAPSIPAKALAWRKLSVSLEQSLELIPLQKPEVEGILREREEEIRTWHDDIRTYEWKVGLLKASWYRRIDSLLDGIQHHRFVVLVEQGLLNDGLAFTVEPGMTVLE
jgi:hypothetical protein